MDSESIGDSGLSDNISSIRAGSSNDLSQIPVSVTNNVVAAEHDIQINLMKGRVEHLEQTREKLIKALETIVTKVKKNLTNT